MIDREPGTDDAPSPAQLFDILSWMSPAWPIGAFAHSGGLEWAVEAGHVTSRASACRWLATLLDHGPLHNDAALFVHAWRAADSRDAGRLRDIAELAAAAQTGHERRTEATAQGAAFRRIALAVLNPPHAGEESTGAAGPRGAGEDLAGLLAKVDDADLTYPVAAATVFAWRGVALASALTAFLHGALGNLVSAAQRLVPLGQTDAQRLLAGLRGPVLAAVEAACALPEDDDPFLSLAGCAVLAELGAMAHETQYTRLFRT